MAPDESCYKDLKEGFITNTLIHACCHRRPLYVGGPICQAEPCLVGRPRLAPLSLCPSWWPQNFWRPPSAGLNQPGPTVHVSGTAEQPWGFRPVAAVPHWACAAVAVQRHSPPSRQGPYTTITCFYRLLLPLFAWRRQHKGPACCGWLPVVEACAVQGRSMVLSSAAAGSTIHTILPASAGQACNCCCCFCWSGPGCPGPLYTGLFADPVLVGYVVLGGAPLAAG